MIRKLLTGGTAASFLLLFAPAFAQSPPPPGVAQGTVPLFPQPVKHVPPVIRSAGLPVRVMRMHDRVVTRDEMLSHVRTIFANIDTNHDGIVTRSELAAFHEKMMHAMAGPDTGQHRMMGARLEQGFGGDSGSTKRRAALFDRLDANHDGVISRQEFMGAGRSMHEGQTIAMHDADGDEPGARFSPGMRMSKRHVDGVQMHDPSMLLMGAHPQAMGHGFGARLFAMADKSHSGRVSLAEVEAAALRHFDQIDLNHDGKITPDERRQAHERMRTGRSAD